MMNKIQDTLDIFFSNLTALIEKLPLSHESKNLMWFDCYAKFFEDQVISKDGSYTQGVTTEWQLRNFYEQFRTRLENSPIKAEGKWLDGLEQLDPSKSTHEEINPRPTLNNHPKKSWQARIWSTFA